MPHLTYSSRTSSDNSSFNISSTSQSATTFSVSSINLTSASRTTCKENTTGNIEQLLDEMQHIKPLEPILVDDDVSLPANSTYNTLQTVELVTPRTNNESFNTNKPAQNTNATSSSIASNKENLQQKVEKLPIQPLQAVHE
ncbi:unnamed protein product, partial [Rotaria sp. Silwood2]